MGAWRGWYHVNGNTYGTWLPGDERGWRARDHKEHVEGDYRYPPPSGMYGSFHAKAAGSMKDRPVFLEPEMRPIAGRAVVEMVVHQGVELLAFSLNNVHYHMLARFGSLLIRPVVGRAKKHAYHVLCGHGHCGRLWSARGRSLPVSDRSHQVNVYEYILGHTEVGAWVWSYKQGIDWEPTIRYPKRHE